MSLLELSALSAAYGAVQALAGLDLAVEEGEIVTLLGANGAGKSTTLRCISGLLASTRGEIRFAGEGISGLHAARVGRLGLAHVT